MKIFILTLLVLASISCRQGEPQETPQPQPQPDVKPKPAPVATFEDALRVAQADVGSARLLSTPLSPLPADTIRGVALPLYNEFPNLSYVDMAKRSAALGASHVSIVVTWRQRTVRHNLIEPSEAETVPDEELKKLIKAAQEAGLKVMLFPIIHIERRSEGEWRGKLKPSDVNSWKAHYEKFILHYAKLAAETGVHSLSVGSELSSMEKEVPFWRSLIKTVRENYNGKLIYSANWDHYFNVQFWDALDYVGVSSYFEVAKAKSDSEHVIAQRWRTHRREMLRFSGEVGRPLVLTEVGYPSVDTSTMKPWDYTAVSHPNHVEQLVGFRALVDAFSEPDSSFGGLFVWHAWGYGGDADTSYAFWDKPSEQLLKRWFQPPTPAP